MRLYRPSESKRRTVMPTGRILLSALDQSQVPSGSFRRVLVVLPENPPVVLVVGPTTLSDPSDIPGIDDSGATPESVADGRAYQWPAPASAGETLKLHLAPENWLTAMSTDGEAHIALYVEYIEP